MKKWLITGSALLILAGCGTSDSTNGNSQEEPAEETEIVEEDTATETEQPEDSAGGDMMIRILEQNIAYKINDVSYEETAFLRESMENNYSLYVLPDFTFTAEEPSKDVITFNENEEQFMRITRHTEDAAAASEALKNPDAGSEPFDLPEGSFFPEDAIAFTQQFDGHSTITIVFTKRDQTISAVISTTDDIAITDPFLKMAQTIE